MPSMSTFRRLLQRLGKPRKTGLDNLPETAIRAQREGRLENAACLYRQALEADPASVPLRVNLGTVLKRMGATAEAEAQYRRAVELAPSFGPAWYNLGLLLHESWRLTQAEDALWRALQVSGGITDREFLSALVRTQTLTLQQLGQHQKARAFLGEATRHFPMLQAECDAIALFALNADPDCSDAERFRVHRNGRSDMPILASATRVGSLRRPAVARSPEFAHVAARAREVHSVLKARSSASLKKPILARGKHTCELRERDPEHVDAPHRHVRERSLSRSRKRRGYQWGARFLLR